MRDIARWTGAIDFRANEKRSHIQPRFETHDLGSNQPMKSKATHKKPDTDALVATWLAERFLFAGCETKVCFVERTFDSNKASPFDCVVDVGRIHSPERRLFDHKPPGYPDRYASCATKLLWEHLIAEGHPVQHLADLVQLVDEGDSVRLRAGSAAY